MKEWFKMKVGIFDSGVGGITVLKQAIEYLPGAEYIYYTDNLHVPYGTKPKEEVYGYVKQIVDFLIEEGVDVIVIACNTATCIAVQRLREQVRIPIIGMEPAVKLALEDQEQGKILVTATPLTLTTDKYNNLVRELDVNQRTVSLPLPELVQFAEKKEFDEDKLCAYFKEKLRPYDLNEFSGMVLGCTHFVYFRRYLEKILPPHMKIYDGNEGTVRHLKECLTSNQLLINTNEEQVTNQITFYYSGEKCKSLDILETYLKLV